MKRFCVALLAVALSFAQTPIVAQEIIDGALFVPERRLEGFVYDGADPKIIAETVGHIRTMDGDSEGSWVAEWRAVAAAEEKRAGKAAKRGDREEARELYFSASNYYAIAGFPEYHSKAERDALMMHLSAYKKGGALMEPALDVVKVTARGKIFDTYLHKPAHIDRPPLILWTHGTDKFKGHAYQTIKSLLDLGFAVATFDIPGTGESIFWNLTPDGEFVHMAVLDAYSERNDIDQNNIFEVGVSFGGYYAAKMAARNDPRLRAVASLCGPVHTPFVLGAEGLAEVLASPEGPTVTAFARRVGADTSDVEAFAEEARNFSLVEQGVVGQGEKIKTPLLVMNGGRDVLAPIEDMEMLADSAKESELWIFGMADHCAKEYFEPALPDIVEWLWQYAATLGDD